MSWRERIEGGLGRLVAASWAERLGLSLAALVASVLVGGLIVFFSGTAATCEEPAYGVFGLTSCYNPISVYSVLVTGAFGNILSDPFNFNVALTLKETTLLIFTGLSVAVAFRAGLFNIGSQGQLIVGGLASAIAVLVAGPFLTGVGGFLLVPLGILAGALGGALYGAIPGALKAYADANEVITTIMLNFVAEQVAFFVVSAYFAAPDSQSVETSEIPSAAVLESALFGSGSDFSIVALAGGLALVAGLYYLIKYTAFGFDLRTSGLQPEAARFGGVDAKRTIVSSMALSGAFAGIGGAVWVLMVLGRFQTGVPALGFDGITVSILAGNNPLGVVPAALLFGVLKSGSLAVQLSTGVPIQLVGVLRGLIILFVAMPEFFRLLGKRFVTTDREPAVATDGGERLQRDRDPRRSAERSDGGERKPAPTESDRSTGGGDAGEPGGEP